MAQMTPTPLLLLDNSNMISLINEGRFLCTNLSFDDARGILDTHDENDVIRCFTNHDIEDIIFDYLGISSRSYAHRAVRSMAPGQDAIVFKLYTTPSETQPIIRSQDGIEAKKIQNVYVYCQLLSRTE
ncbi:MAG: hypothetical protein PHD32_00060 [Eubacteriales bacterium]|nr:hypothetical protein [Eubacteriales bacterium]